MHIPYVSVFFSLNPFYTTEDMPKILIYIIQIQTLLQFFGSGMKKCIQMSTNIPNICLVASNIAHSVLFVISTFKGELHP